MANIIFRRKGLGGGSLRSVVDKMHTPVTIVRSDRLGNMPKQVTKVIRWGCTAYIFPDEEVFNSRQGISWVANKARTRASLPDLCPKTWFSMGEWREWAGPLGVPQGRYILRPTKHAGGNHALAMHAQEAWLGSPRLGEFLQTHPEIYISEVVRKIAEYRVFVSNGRCVCVVLKSPEDLDRLLWNRAQGTFFANIRWSQWPLDAVRVALRAFDKVGLDFGAADIIRGDDEKPYLLEINSAPSATTDYRQQCLAKTFDYLLTTGREKVSIDETVPDNDFKKYIHPAICEAAVVGPHRE